LVTCFSVLIAGILPAWAAGRVKPIEAMSLLAQQDVGMRLGVRAVIAALTFVGALLCFAVGRGGSMTMSIASTVSGLILLAVSLLVVVPVAIRVCERLIGPLIARGFGLPPALLQHQQGAHLARASGMLLTIAVCLGFSVIMNVWGRSMVTPFLPAPELPEQVISILPGGVPPASAGEVGMLPGLDPARVLPLVAEQTMVGPTLMAMTKGGMDEIYVQIIGVDPQALAPTGHSMLPVQSEDGDLTAHLAALATPGACLVPSSFARRFNLKVGDTFPLFACGGSAKPVDMHIVGIASLPGWQWITKMGRMRTLDGKPTAVLLMSPATTTLLGVESVRHWLADTTPTFDRATLRTALQTLAEKHAAQFESAHFGLGEQSRPSVKMIATGEVARRMRTRSDEVIWVLGAIPLAGLIVAILGVANAVAAGIRARRWEFGVLRAIGLERRHAQALILAETVVITTTAGVLCIIFGIITAWAAIDMSLRLFNTGTGAPPLALPWLDMLIAWLITTVICALAAIIPARRLARATPLTLLQEGRATM
jgi:putative ABC transport system permease protein